MGGCKRLRRHVNCVCLLFVVICGSRMFPRWLLCLLLGVERFLHLPAQGMNSLCGLLREINSSFASLLSFSEIRRAFGRRPIGMALEVVSIC